MCDIENETNTVIPTTCWSQFLKDRRQFHAILSCLTLSLVTGLHLGWSLYRIDFSLERWSHEPTVYELCLVHVGLFMGILVGGFNCGYFMNAMGRKNVVYIAIIAYIAGSLIIAVFPATIFASFIGKIIIGYGAGTIQLVLLTICGEIPTSWNRGMHAALIQFSVTLGIFLFTILHASVPHNTDRFHINRVVGCFSIAFTVIAYIFQYFYGVESPLYYLMREKYTESSKLMRTLRDEETESEGTRFEYEEMKIMVMEDRLEGGPIVFTPTLYFILLIKFLSVLAFTQPFNYVRIALLADHIGNIRGQLWQPTFLILVKLFATALPVFTMDAYGRVHHIKWGSRILTVLLIAMGTLRALDIWAVCIVVFLYEFFVGFGMRSAIDTYCTEVFSTTKKGTGLSLVVFVEHFTQFLLVGMTVALDVSKLTHLLAIFMTAAIVVSIGVLQLPETRRLTLKEARRRFHRIDFSIN